MSQDLHTVRAVFTFKDSESKSKFVDFCNGEKGLSVARNWPGCHLFEFYQLDDNTNKVIIWQKWLNKESHESYVKMRREEGTFDMLSEWVVSPPEVDSLSLLNFKSDKELVEEVIKDMCNVDYKLGMKHMHDDCVFVRPSGNPLNKEGWEKMMTNEDVNVESNDLVAINKLHVEGDMAYVCYTTHGKFNYKGNENDDVAVLTSVLKKVDGKWMVVLGQRSTGRKPEETLPQF
jgi:ketosteroid isomerase-like protein/quinol monooxygenase YgiN